MEFHSSPKLGGGESLEGTKSLTLLAEKLILVLGSHKNATDTEKGYEGMHSFTKHSDHRP